MGELLGRGGDSKPSMGVYSSISRHKSKTDFIFLFCVQAQELVSNENILLQTLGFDVAIDHPHTHVVRCCQLVKGEGSSPWNGFESLGRGRVDLFIRSSRSFGRFRVHPLNWIFLSIVRVRFEFLKLIESILFEGIESIPWEGLSPIIIPTVAILLQRYIKVSTFFEKKIFGIFVIFVKG